MAIKRGTKFRDVLVGTTSADQLFGAEGNDDLFGRAGNDKLFGDAGSDRLFGEAGNDLLDGGTGNDSMSGGTGNDSYVVNSISDRVSEGVSQGLDSVSSSISLTLGANVERLALTGTSALSGTGNSLNNFLTGNAGANVLRGGNGNDSLFGGGGSDQLFGGNGNDWFRPGAGNTVGDVINGGDNLGPVGTPLLGEAGDIVDYSDALASVYVDLTTGLALRAAQNDIITKVESVIGSRFNDRLTASGVAHSLASGGGGNDMILGSGADYDRLRGDDGFDFLFGDNGSNDDFVLQYDRGLDTIRDFAPGDHILISHSEFGLTTTFGFLSAAEWLTVGLSDQLQLSARGLWYDAGTRILWADKDGAGLAFGAVPVASFHPLSIAPSPSNIFVI